MKRYTLADTFYINYRCSLCETVDHRCWLVSDLITKTTIVCCQECYWYLEDRHREVLRMEEVL